MIQVPDPPQQHACASCQQPLTWLWSPRKTAWVAFVPMHDTMHAIRPHGCRHAQDARVWRELLHGDPPNDDYLQAREQLKNSTGKDTT